MRDWKFHPGLPSSSIASYCARVARVQSILQDQIRNRIRNILVITYPLIDDDPPNTFPLQDKFQYLNSLISALNLPQYCHRFPRCLLNNSIPIPVNACLSLYSYGTDSDILAGCANDAGPRSRTYLKGLLIKSSYLPSPPASMTKTEVLLSAESRFASTRPMITRQLITVQAA